MPRKFARNLAPLVFLLSFGAFLRSDDGPTAGADAAVGWASVEGGTQGGAGGLTVMVADAASLELQVQGDDPRIVQIAGTIRLSGPVKVRSHKTILGMGAEAKLVGGGLHLSGVNDVIIRNIAIADAPDAIGIEQKSHHIWIDHCDLSHCDDGLLDIKRGSDLITVSWNRFHDHHKTCLVGHSDKEEIRRGDTGHLRVTYHHNFFDGTSTRHPRVRFAEGVHVFNNYYRNNEYGVASVMDAGVLVEGNFFEGVDHPTHTRYGDSPDPGRLVERNNLFERCAHPPETRGTIKELTDSYRYTLDKAAEVRDIVSKSAGRLR
jgi:pectate lyase